MRKIATLTLALTLPLGLTLLHCGGDDEGSGGSALCKQVDAKLDECSVTFGSGECSAKGEREECLAQCIVDSPCESLTDDSATSSFVQCTLACQGAGPDWFTCADGSGAVEPAGVCNGRFECGDGSDEASCGDAGAS